MSAIPTEDWQKRFFANTKVFEVYAFGESTGNFYETREGAEIEVAWRLGRGEKARVVGHNLHSDELSRERWTP